MTEVDQLIREALNEEDAKWFDELEEQSVPEMVVESFRGRTWWLVLMVYAFVLVFAVLAVLTGVQFWKAANLESEIRWGVAFLFCIATLAMLKVWYWMELNRIAVTREIKRFELQLARLSHRIEGEA